MATTNNETMSESSNESFKPYQVAFDAYRKDLDEVCAISERLVASADRHR